MNKNIYDDKTYLKKNPNWHIEDSPYKVSLVLKAIKRSNINFKNMIDIGCGAGVVTNLLSEKYPDKQFQGIDVSQDASKFWQEGKNGNLKFSGDSDDFFDLAICLDVFEHVEDYMGFLKNIKSKAKTFIFNIPLDMSVIKLVSPGLRHAREDVGHLHYFNSFTALATLEKCGYVIEDSFLSAAFLKTKPRNFKQLVLLFPRLLTLFLGKKMGSILFGGISIVVTTSTE